jgi:serine/threonine protein kinase
MAAIRDSMDRAAQQGEFETTDRNSKHSNDDGLTAGDSKRRLLDDVPAGASKRHRKNKMDERMTVKDANRIGSDLNQHTEVCPPLRWIPLILLVTHLTCQNILKAANVRNLMLIRLHYGVYNSPVPASFLRCGPSLSPVISSSPPRKAKDTYVSHEYFTLVLTSQIANGATGIVHGAILELETSDAQPLTQEVVVKLAFLEEQQERMRNEYAIYQHLGRANVAGIPKVLGLFEDLEGGSIALVMNNAGVALCEQRTDRSGQVTVSASERCVTLMHILLPVGKADNECSANFSRILQDIHRAGVRHRDIRPENLLVNDAGDAVIIDFDKATLRPTKEAQNREAAILTQLLDGKYYGPDIYLSPRSNVESDVD